SPQEIPAPEVPTPTPQVEERPHQEITIPEKIIPPAPQVVKKPQLQPTEEPAPLPKVQPEVPKLPPPKLKQPKLKNPS
ncbi:MAG: hypothetical protein KAJ51_06165, partial [Thermoplasmata archaeon]|nr:hypothetical protein [Thermoplasmata archaeon]